MGTMISFIPILIYYQISKVCIEWYINFFGIKENETKINFGSKKKHFKLDI